MGCSFGCNVNIALSSIVFTRLALGEVLIFQLTTNPSKQSVILDKYTLAAGILTSVI